MEHDGETSELINGKLITAIRRDGRLSEVMVNFSKIVENTSKVKFLSSLLNEYNLLGNYGTLKIPKNDKKSEECRELGNKLYSKKEFIDAVTMYNRSLCYAEYRPNLALTYANRSAVCFELKMYSTCLENIEMAKQHDYPSEKMANLDKRAEKCKRMIEEGAESDESQLKPIGEEFLKLSHPPHPKLPFIADCLEMKYTEDFGRYVTTNKRLNPGEIICIEESFSKYLLPTHKYKNCINCLNDNFLRLVPCPKTTSAMFCSQQCMNEANDSFYKYESDVIDELNRICPKVYRSALKSFFQSLKAYNSDLEMLKSVSRENENNSGLSIFDVDNPLDQADIFRAIEGLKVNEQRNHFDHFERSVLVAILVDLFTRHTKLADLLPTEDDRMFFLKTIYKHIQIAISNYHGLGNGVMKSSELEKNPRIGGGSFPFCSLINHACSQNVFRRVLNNKNHVIVLKVIEAGEQLFDDYGFHFEKVDLATRQSHLQDYYSFDCHCEACQNNYPLLGNLPSRDPESKMILIAEKLFRFDVGSAKKLFKTVCKYLNEKNDLHPCFELNVGQACLKKCFTIFVMSKLKLKLAGKC